jgi:hypothetical protein
MLYNDIYTKNDAEQSRGQHFHKNSTKNQVSQLCTKSVLYVYCSIQRPVKSGTSKTAAEVVKRYRQILLN